jgi:hypothetical protein
MKINVVLGHAVSFPPNKGGGIETCFQHKPKKIKSVQKNQKI